MGLKTPDCVSKNKNDSNTSHNQSFHNKFTSHSEVYWLYKLSLQRWNFIDNSTVEFPKF